MPYADDGHWLSIVLNASDETAPRSHHLHSSQLEASQHMQTKHTCSAVSLQL